MNMYIDMQMNNNIILHIIFIIKMIFCQKDLFSFWLNYWILLYTIVYKFLYVTMYLHMRGEVDA